MSRRSRAFRAARVSRRATAANRRHPPACGRCRPHDPRRGDSPLEAEEGPALGRTGGPRGRPEIFRAASPVTSSYWPPPSPNGPGPRASRGQGERTTSRRAGRGGLAHLAGEVVDHLSDVGRQGRSRPAPGVREVEGHHAAGQARAGTIPLRSSHSSGSFAEGRLAHFDHRTDGLNRRASAPRRPLGLSQDGGGRPTPPYAPFKSPLTPYGSSKEEVNRPPPTILPLP
jgi:hypothetical protein